MPARKVLKWLIDSQRQLVYPLTIWKRSQPLRSPLSNWIFPVAPDSASAVHISTLCWFLREAVAMQHRRCRPNLLLWIRDGNGEAKWITWLSAQWSHTKSMSLLSFRCIYTYPDEFVAGKKSSKSSSAAVGNVNPLYMANEGMALFPISWFSFLIGKFQLFQSKKCISWVLCAAKLSLEIVRQAPATSQNLLVHVWRTLVLQPMQTAAAKTKRTHFSSCERVLETIENRMWHFWTTTRMYIVQLMCVCVRICVSIFVVVYKLCCHSASATHQRQQNSIVCARQASLRLAPLAQQIARQLDVNLFTLNSSAATKIKVT